MDVERRPCIELALTGKGVVFAGWGVGANTTGSIRCLMAGQRIEVADQKADRSIPVEGTR